MHELLMQQSNYIPNLGGGWVYTLLGYGLGFMEVLLTSNHCGTVYLNTYPLAICC